MMNIAEIIQEELTRLRQDIIARSEAAGQRASGRTYAQIEVQDVTDQGGKLVGPGYVGVLATGRRSGKIPYDFIRIIKEWATYKGITFADEKEFDRWANAVAWKIRREGTQLWRHVGKGGGYEDIFNTPIDECIGRLIERLAEYYQMQFVDKITELWQ